MMANKYNWKITAKKFLISLAEIIVVGTIAFFTGKPDFLVLIPILEAIKNWIKHKN